MKRLVFAVLALAASAAAPAETLDINLGDEDLRVVFAGPLNRFLEATSGEYELGAIVDRGNDGEDDFVQGHLGLLVSGDAGAKQANVTAGLGARVALMDRGPFSGSALEIGGQVEVRHPTVNRVSFRGYVFGAPSVLSFGDTESAIEYALAVDYQVIRQASLYLGYRQVKVKVDEAGTQTADTGVHAGLRLNF
ncbi:MAG: hypothetical protein HYV18_05670 [Gammaproteobacteria bacterium]|nr:hypothetical protein [Gammaproteobacteria bacterium]